VLKPEDKKFRSVLKRAGKKPVLRKLASNVNPKRRPKKFTKGRNALKQELLYLFNSPNQYTEKELAKKLNIKLSSVKNLKRELGLSKARIPKQQQVECISEMLQQGIRTISKMMLRLGVSAQTIEKRLREMGCDPKQFK
jgi:methylphosphotriester-DNA--protein-cysteine methyltransferase